MQPLEFLRPVSSRKTGASGEQSSGIVAGLFILDSRITEKGDQKKAHGRENVAMECTFLEPNAMFLRLWNMRREYCTFQFRFEGALLRQIQAGKQRLHIGLGRLVERALVRSMLLHRQGRLLFREASGFLCRTDREDRISVMLRLEKEPKETARALAFAYRRSQAEVIRVALEVYLGFLMDEKILSNNYYSIPQIRIQSVEIIFLPPYTTTTIFSTPRGQPAASS